jgi:hypothetical protein
MFDVNVGNSNPREAKFICELKLQCKHRAFSQQLQNPPTKCMSWRWIMRYWLSQRQCDRDITILFVIHSVQKGGRYLHEHKMSGTDGRLSFTDKRSSVCTLYKEHGWPTSIHMPWNAAVSESAVNRKESMMVWHPPIKVSFSVSSNSLCSISVAPS